MGDTKHRSQEFGASAVGDRVGPDEESGGDAGGVAEVVEGAHEGDVLAIGHVDGSLSLSTSLSEGVAEGLSEGEDGAEGSWSSLFVSGGKGDE